MVGLGDSAGASILLRLGLAHPARVHGLVLVNFEGVARATLREKLGKEAREVDKRLNLK